MKIRKRFYVSCLLAAALGLGFSPRAASAGPTQPTQQQLEDQLKQLLAKGAKAAADGAIQGAAGQLNSIAQSEKTGEPLHDAALSAAQAGISLISQIMQMLLDKVLNGTATPQDIQQLGNLQNQADNLNNGNFGTPGSGTPGSGTPGSGTPGSGTPGVIPGTGTPGGVTPGTGTPGSGLPGTTGGSGTPGSGLPGTTGGSGTPGSGTPGSGTPGGIDPTTGTTGSTVGGDPSGTGAVNGGSDPYGTSAANGAGGPGGINGGATPTGGGYGGGGGGYGGGGDGSSGSGGINGGSGGAGGGAGGAGAGGKGAGAVPKVERVKGRLVLLPRGNKKPLAKLFQTDVDGRVSGNVKAVDSDKLQKLFAKVKKGDEIGDSLARVEFTIFGWKQALKSGIKAPAPQAGGDDDELGEGPSVHGRDGKIDLTRCDAWIVADWQGASPKRYMVRFKDTSLDYQPGVTLLVRGAVAPLSSVPQDLKADFPGEIATLDAQDVAVAPPESATTGSPETPGATAPQREPGKFSGNGSAAPNSKPASPGTAPGKGQKPAASDDDELKED